MIKTLFELTKEYCLENYEELDIKKLPRDLRFDFNQKIFDALPPYERKDLKYYAKFLYGMNHNHRYGTLGFYTRKQIISIDKSKYLFDIFTLDMYDSFMNPDGGDILFVDPNISKYRRLIALIDDLKYFQRFRIKSDPLNSDNIYGLFEYPASFHDYIQLSDLIQ